MVVAIATVVDMLKCLLLVLALSRQAFCYHNGMQFLTAHTAFNLAVERSLQMINPKVSLASWDFMIDASKLGTE